MTCIYCRIDVKASQRTDGACPTCHRPFAFDPKRGDKLTDLAWSAAFERLSQGGTVKFTRRNLYYEIARRMQKRRRTELLILGGLSLGWTVAAVVSSPFFLIGTMATGLAAIKSTPRPTIRLGEADFEALLRRWTAAHGTPPGLIVRSDGSAPTPERPLPPDFAH